MDHCDKDMKGFFTDVLLLLKYVDIAIFNTFIIRRNRLFLQIYQAKRIYALRSSWRMGTTKQDDAFIER